MALLACAGFLCACVPDGRNAAETAVAGYLRDAVAAERADGADAAAFAAKAAAENSASRAALLRAIAVSNAVHARRVEGVCRGKGWAFTGEAPAPKTASGGRGDVAYLRDRAREKAQTRYPEFIKAAQLAGEREAAEALRILADGARGQAELMNEWLENPRPENSAHTYYVCTECGYLVRMPPSLLCVECGVSDAHVQPADERFALLTEQAAATP